MIGIYKSDLTPDIQKARSNSKYDMNDLREDDILTFRNIFRSVNFDLIDFKPGEKKSLGKMIYQNV